MIIANGVPQGGAGGSAIGALPRGRTEIARLTGTVSLTTRRFLGVHRRARLGPTDGASELGVSRSRFPGRI